MKCPDERLEAFEFNIGRAPELRCTNRHKATTCGSCETCVLGLRIANVAGWFCQAGLRHQKSLVVGLIRRVNSADLLRNIVRTLRPLASKDSVYALNRGYQTIDGERIAIDGNGRVVDRTVERCIEETLDWFTAANYWTKANFLNAILRISAVQLLNIGRMEANDALQIMQNKEITSVTGT